jgi:hypothetical protein
MMQAEIFGSTNCLLDIQFTRCSDVEKAPEFFFREEDIVAVVLSFSKSNFIDAVNGMTVQLLSGTATLQSRDVKGSTFRS